MPEYITDDIEISFDDSDREDSTEKKILKKKILIKKILMKKIKYRKWNLQKQTKAKYKNYFSMLVQSNKVFFLRI